MPEDKELLDKVKNMAQQVKPSESRNFVYDLILHNFSQLHWYSYIYAQIALLLGKRIKINSLLLNKANKISQGGPRPKGTRLCGSH